MSRSAGNRAAKAEPATTTLSWASVLAWRLRRQLLDPIGSADVLETVRRMCGVQAQVPSSAELAVCVRRDPPQPGPLKQALADRALMRTWAMRGTLHVLAPDDAGAYLSLMGARRAWERPAWQRTFGVTAGEIETIAEVVTEVLDGRVLDREELIEAIAQRTNRRELDEHLRSGWGAVLKPLAWMGLLCNGPSRGNRVTFTSPRSWARDWTGVPKPDAAARVAIPAYLHTYGPARLETFDAWLSRGTSRKADLRRWFAELQEDGVLSTVDVERERCYAVASDLDELQRATPSGVLRLLPGFDQYVLGPGTSDSRILAPERRKLVSKAAGWISPTVVRGGRVVGTWELDGDAIHVSVFEEAGKLSPELLEPEVSRIGACLGRELKLTTAIRDPR